MLKAKLRTDRNLYLEDQTLQKKAVENGDTRTLFAKLKQLRQRKP